MKNVIATPWSDVRKYRNGWNDRNQRLFELTSNVNIKSFTEYGCGPRAPFNKILLDNKHQPAILYDQCIWETLNNNLVDFNTPFDDLYKSQCGVLSGVFEYIEEDSLLFVLKKLKLSHDFLLYSLSEQTDKHHVETYNFKVYYQQIANEGNVLKNGSFFDQKVFLLKFNK